MASGKLHVFKKGPKLYYAVADTPADAAARLRSGFERDLSEGDLVSVEESTTLRFDGTPAGSLGGKE